MAKPTNKELATLMVVANLKKLTNKFLEADKVKLQKYLEVVLHGKPTHKEIAVAYVVYGMLASIEHMKRLNDPREFEGLAVQNGHIHSFKMTSQRIKSILPLYQYNVGRVVDEFSHYMTTRGYSNFTGTLAHFVPKEPEEQTPIGLCRTDTGHCNYSTCNKVGDYVEQLTERAIKLFDPYLTSLQKRRSL